MTEFMLVGSRQRVATLTQELDLSINGISLKRVNSSKCLGVEIDEFLTWDAHFASVSKKYHQVWSHKEDQAICSYFQLDKCLPVNCGTIFR